AEILDQPSQVVLIVVSERDKTKRLKDAARRLVHRIQHFRHPVHHAGLRLKRNLNKVAFGNRIRQLQEPTGGGYNLEFAFGTVAVVEPDQGWCGLEFDTSGTMRRITLGKVCHGSSNMALCPNRREITEAHCTNSSCLRVIASEFYPF